MTAPRLIRLNAPMLASVFALALATGLAAPSAPRSVADGNIAQTCQWPTVVSFRAGEDKCSGTLVHPRVIVTAAHCLDDALPGAIRLGEHFQPAARLVDVERCGADPDFARTGAPSDDIGYCVLQEPADGIPPTPLLMGCETVLLAEGEPAVIVGLGVSEEDDDFGTKRYAFTALDSDLRPDGTVWIGDARVNGCFGDSGGPAFIQAPGGTWHAIGVLSFGPGCGQGPMLYRSLHDRIGWLEEQTGYDLSPCHDAEGGWEPGPDCGMNVGTVAVDPLAEGTWDNACAGELASAPQCPTELEPEPEDAEDSGSDGHDSDDSTASASTAADPGASDTDADGCGCHHHDHDHPQAGTRPGWLAVSLLALGFSCRRPRRPRSGPPR